MIQLLKAIKDLESAIENLSISVKKVVFDYKNMSIGAMNPSYGDRTMGLCDSKEGILYVGKDRDKSQRYGTFAHELMHYVLDMIYENECLPYTKDDQDRKELFRVVLEETRKIYEADKEADLMADPETERESEPIIQWVFECYEPGDVQLAELIVRVAHILAYYLNDQDKVNRLKEKFHHLFDFFKNYVLPDLNESHAYRMITLNNNFTLLDKIHSYDLKIEKNEDNNIILNDGGFIVLPSDIPDLTLSQIYEKLSVESKNSFELKIKNVFVDIKFFENNNLKTELEDLINRCGKVKRVVIDAREERNECEFLEKLSKIKSCCVAVVVVSSNFKTMSEQNKIISYKWKDLTEKSRDFILNRQIKFQGVWMKAKEILPNFDFSSQALAHLCDDNEISINNLENFATQYLIPRHIIRRRIASCSLEKSQLKKIVFKKEEFSPTKITSTLFALENFVDEVADDHIVVISDIAGSGKTTVLKIIYEYLSNTKKKHWITIVNLKELEKLFSNKEDKRADSNSIEKIPDLDNFTEVMSDQILKLNDFEKFIFTQKYNEGLAVILFDGYDEVQNDVTPKLLNLFRSHRKVCKSQIWITTRSHLSEFLEKELTTIAHNLKSFEENEEINYLNECLRDVVNDENMRKTYVERIVTKINELLTITPNKQIGTPVIIHLVAKMFEREEDPANISQRIEELKFHKIFKSAVRFEIESLSLKYPDVPMLYIQKDTNLMHLYHYFAVKNNFNSETASLLDLFYNEKEWPIDEIARNGLIHHDSCQKFYFKHSLFIEYFVSDFITERFLHSNSLSKNLLDFFYTILVTKKYEITRLFLNDSIEKIVEKYKPNNADFSSSKSKVLGKLCSKNAIKILDLSAREGLIELCTFILNLIKNHKEVVYKKVFELKSPIERNSIFMSLVLSMRLDEKWTLFVKEVFQLYPKPLDLYKFLIRRNVYENTIFHLLTYNLVCPQKFKLFWHEVHKQISTENEKKIFFLRNICKETCLCTAANSFKKGNVQFIEILEVLKKIHPSAEEQMEIVKNGTIMFESSRNDVVFYELINFIKELPFSERDWVFLLNKTNEDNCNIFVHAAFFGSLATVKLLFATLRDKADKALEKSCLLKRTKGKISIFNPI